MHILLLFFLCYFDNCCFIQIVHLYLLNMLLWYYNALVWGNDLLPSLTVSDINLWMVVFGPNQHLHIPWCTFRSCPVSFHSSNKAKEIPLSIHFDQGVYTPYSKYHGSICFENLDLLMTARFIIVMHTCTAVSRTLF